MEGFMYPNEVELQRSVLIVLYPFLTGLVAGAFILASLERIFRVEEVKPTYRLALLTALAFLIVAPLPLQLHLGHPERSLFTESMNRTNLSAVSTSWCTRAFSFHRLFSRFSLALWSP